MASGNRSRPQLHTELSTDAVPWITANPSNEISMVSMDAIPGRRYPGGRPPLEEPQRNAPVLQRNPPAEVTTSSPQPESLGAVRAQHSQPEKLSLKSQTSEEDILGQVVKKIESWECSGSMDSNYSSFSSSDDSSLQLQDLAAEIEKYKQHMPSKLKAPFVDVLILYADEDRNEAEKFRQHLMTEINLPGGEHVMALLYDCPEFTSLSGSMLQHLDLAVERSTYIFVYLTKSFVECKWCEISSESCLMKAIYDEEKRWCVVPVYTERRNQCKFKIPMGLNSLKGINYYNNDKFYRDGVARLIGDKVNVKSRNEEDLKVKQKEWIEKYKREQEKLKEMQVRAKLLEEEKTRMYVENLREDTELWRKEGLIPSYSETNLYPFHQSSSTNSLKDMTDPNPNVREYFDQLRQQNIGQLAGGGHHMFFGQQRSDNQQPFVPPVENAAYYSHTQHAVRRSPSQNSAVSKDGANSQPIPPEIMNKLKDLTLQDREKYISLFLRESQSIQQQEQAVMNMPPQHQPLPMSMANQIQPGLYSGQMYHGNHSPRQSPSQGQPPPAFAGVDPLAEAPSLNLSLLGHVQPGSMGTHGNQSVGPPRQAMASQVPNILEQSMNSYHPHSVPDNTSFGGSSMMSRGNSSFSTRQSSQGQSMDGLRSGQGGNMPVSGLFQSESIETDSASFQLPVSTNKGMDFEQEYKETDSLDDNVCIKPKQLETKTKREKHVHYIINIYQADSVQIGDSNKVENVGRPAGEASEESSEGESDIDDDDRPSPKKSTNPNTASKQHREANDQAQEGLSTVADAPPSTAPTEQGPMPFPKLENNLMTPSPTKKSEGEKPVGLIRPISPPNPDSEETMLKQVFPGDQTTRKVAHIKPVQPMQILQESSPNQQQENTETGCQSSCSSTNPTGQSPSPNTHFCRLNVSNPSVLFYRRPVIPSVPPNSMQGESAGFQPITMEEDCANDFDMLDNDDYEGGEFTESINHSLEGSGKSQTKNTIANLFARLTKGVH